MFNCWIFLKIEITLSYLFVISCHSETVMIVIHATTNLLFIRYIHFYQYNIASILKLFCLRQIWSNLAKRIFPKRCIIFISLDTTLTLKGERVEHLLVEITKLQHGSKVKISREKTPKKG